MDCRMRRDERKPLPGVYLEMRAFLYNQRSGYGLLESQGTQCERAVKGELKSAIARSANVMSVEHGVIIMSRKTITQLE